MKKYLDPKNLPFAGAVVQAVLFALAGIGFFPVAGWLVGLGVGAVVNYSMALASSRFAEIAEKRKPLARVAMVVMFALSPTTITLSMFFPKSIFTAIAWAVCVDLAIILAGAIAGKSMIGDASPTKVAGKEKQGKGKKKQIARKRVTDNDLLAYLQSNAGATHGQVAEHFGVTRQAIQSRVKKLYEVKS
jgi:uncharacterized membrane protein (DUF485 family)